jgi:hypothetical protein
MSDPLPQEGYFTYKDYRTWELAEGERYELIDGVVYAMSAPNDRIYGAEDKVSVEILPGLDVDLKPIFAE